MCVCVAVEIISLYFLVAAIFSYVELVHWQLTVREAGGRIATDNAKGTPRSLEERWTFTLHFALLFFWLPLRHCASAEFRSRRGSSPLSSLVLFSLCFSPFSFFCTKRQHFRLMPKQLRDSGAPLSTTTALLANDQNEAPPAQRVKVDETTHDISSSGSEAPDRERSTPSSASSFSSVTTSASSASDEDEGEVEARRQRLLDYARATALSQRKASSSATDGNTGNGPAAMLRGVSGGATANAKPKASAAAALQQMTEALLQPVVTSTALTVVNAEDESAELLDRIVSKKVPPPPAGEAKRLRQLTYVNHSEMNYIPIRRDFYVVPPDVKDLTHAEMKELLKELDGAKVRGDAVPRPLRTWHATGLPDRVLKVLERHRYTSPFAVQSLGAPALMSGRDLLITAKTGSGKTLCYALPLVRHAADQPRCEKGEGPIGLVLVPTQELAVQVYDLLQELCSAAEIRCVASYGSTPLSENIRLVKAGCEVMVATPGRLLDLLTVNGGKTFTLSRVSMVIVDEADRLFDSGFMEHVSAFLRNIRPDRVVGMISATLPRELRGAIMKHMQNPVEITVGGKPTPASNVEQQIIFFDEEVYDVDNTQREMSPRLLKLLAVLGDEGSSGKKLILIFTQRREEVDELLARLSTLGYMGRIATLYSGMDPIDREFALEHFVPGKQFILIATAVAERGLDIPFLELVINYRLPNHYEAYVHRIGRTGRAGRSGRAISFFTRGKDDDIAPELVEGLERAEQQVPEELYEIAAKVRALRKSGDVKFNHSFYRGYMNAKAQRFTERSQKTQLREAARAAGLEQFLSSSSAEDSDADSNSDSDIVQVQVQGDKTADEAVAASTALRLHRGVRDSSALTLSAGSEDRIAKALAYADKMNAAATAALTEDTSNIRFESEYPINDLPDVVRGKLQAGGFLRSVAEETETTIIRKGVYYDPRYKHSHRLKEGDRPLFLLIVGRSADTVREARHRLDAMKTEVLGRQSKKTSALGATL